MATKRAMQVSELSFYASFGGLRMPLEKVKAEVEAGASLEIEESSFRDPGGDYTRVLLNGKAIGYMAGY